MQELKAQARVDGDEEDALLTVYGDAAEGQIIGMTRRTPRELINMNANRFPDQLRVAILMFAAHLYRQREAVVPGAAMAVPYGLEFLVRPFVKLAKNSGSTWRDTAGWDEEELWRES